MTSSLKTPILALLKKGKTYREISASLKCAISTVSYYSKLSGIKSKNIPHIPTESEIQDMRTYYLNHTLSETGEQFKLSKTTILRHCPPKHVKFTEEERRANNYFRVKRRRQNLKARMIEYRGGACEICNYSKCIQALEFHHKDPKKKKFSLSTTRSYWNWSMIKRELNKCILICANCHRELHSKIPSAPSLS
jgi:hypothetical protein